MKKYTYKTQGTCSQAIEITVDDDNRIDSVQFIGGCDGNTKGISSLVRGMKVQDVIAKLRGITCGYKSTGCPDQLSKALEAML